MSIDEFKVELENRISEFFSQEIELAPTPEAGELLTTIETLIKRGGKRLRPQLLFLSYKSYGGTDFHKVIDVGLSLELHHQFLLIHDDIMDNDNVRYDGPNIVGHYEEIHSPDNNKLPLAMGVLAGDLLSTFSNLVIANTQSLTNLEKVRINKLLNATNVGVSYGQQLDIYSEIDSIESFSEDRMLLTHSLKTALYTVRLPMQCAAILTKLNQTERKKIEVFAKNFGILFQLIDDYSDYFVSKSFQNKFPKYRDFQQGKVTYPLFIALSKADQKDYDDIRKHLGQKTSPEKTLNSINEILIKYRADVSSKSYIDVYVNKTFLSLEDLGIDKDSKKSFIDIIDKSRP